MKALNKSIYLMLIALALVFTTSSCNKDDDGGGGGGASAGTVKAKINGTSFTSAEISTSGTITNAGGMQTFMLIGSNSSGKAIAVTIIGFDGEGTYQIGGGANISVSASYTETDINNPMNTQVWQAPFDASVAGEISFSEVSDTKAKGTFHFTGKNVNGDNSTKEITEGAFNVNVQVY